MANIDHQWRQEWRQEWRQGELVDISIANLSNSGDGVGRWGDRVVFVPDAVPGDRLLARLVRVKPTYAHGKIHELLTPSPHRIRPNCIVADKCGGCQWQFVSYEQQLIEKRNQVIQALERIGGLENPPVDPVLPSEPLGYRNKATYPLQRVSAKPTNGRGNTSHKSLQTPSSSFVQAGYYQKGSHKLINLNQCPVQDQRLNPLLAGVKHDIQQRGWSIYDENRHQGQLRHLGLRIGQRTGEILLTLVSRDADLAGLEDQAKRWLDRYPGLVGVSLNLNPKRTNAIFGEDTRCIAGHPYLREIFAGLEFQIRPTTFFQINTAQADTLLAIILDELDLQGTELVLDAYCGVGTLTLPLATQARWAVGLEIQPEAIEQAIVNANLNGITNVTFQAGSVETLMPRLSDGVPNELKHPDLVVLDPPRKGCDRTVLDTLLTLQPDRIVYVSCNPATLARDLKILCDDGRYHLTRVQPADFFPQTAHVECAAFLKSTTVLDNEP
ncbi:MAG: 23S rRNA (uracil(1939)-C(5))-methyltransferase RlmD [Elainellaceae cyanobacterium]